MGLRRSWASRGVVVVFGEVLCQGTREQTEVDRREEGDMYRSVQRLRSQCLSSGMDMDGGVRARTFGMAQPKGTNAPPTHLLGKEA